MGGGELLGLRASSVSGAGLHGMRHRSCRVVGNLRPGCLRKIFEACEVAGRPMNAMRNRAVASEASTARTVCPRLRFTQLLGRDMSQENPQRIKVRIPVLVSRTGEVQTGWFAQSADGKSSFDHDGAVDSFSEEAYKSGYVVVYVNAEIDEDGLFRNLEEQGVVSSS